MIVSDPTAVPAIEPIPDGGVTSAQGFVAAGIHAGFRRNPNRRDMALVIAERPCPCAGTFTQNPFASAPVFVSRDHVAKGTAKAVVVNSGNANAATGERGLVVARQTCEIAAAELGCDPDEVLVSSTGVVGAVLNPAPFKTGIPQAHAIASKAGGIDAANAILTTDTYAKHYAVSYVSKAPGYEGCRITIGGMTKGSGMIMPNMATMIAVVTTDAPLDHPTLQHALLKVVGESFNKVVVDADTSPNDTCLLLASGLAAEKDICEGTPAFEEFVFALDAVCEHLARAMAQDGEGSTKLVTVNVSGAATPEDADTAARKVASSMLVKTAIFGHDCNWGRIAVSLGTSGVPFDVHNVSIDIMGIPVCRHGMAVEFDEDEALRRFEADEVIIDANLGEGDASCTIWTCDLTYDYVRINGEYRT